MDSQLTVRVLSRAEVAALSPGDWDDPDGMTALPDRVRRMMATNPFATGPDDPALLVAAEASRAAGRFVLFYGQAQVRGEPVRILWACELLVSPAFRGRGIASRLVNAWREQWHTSIGCGVTIEAQGVYQKLGWPRFDTPRYLMPLHTGVFVRAFAGRALGNALGFAGDALLRLLRGAVALPDTVRLRGLHVSVERQLDPALDPLLAMTRTPAAVHRSARWVNWLIELDVSEHPGQQRVCIVRDERGRPVGYFLLRQQRVSYGAGRFHDVLLGSVKDFAIFDPQRLTEPGLMLLAAGALGRWGTNVARFCTSDPAAGRLLRRLGARPTSSLVTILNARPPSPLSDPTFLQPSSWTLSAAAADHFFG